MTPTGARRRGVHRLPRASPSLRSRPPGPGPASAAHLLPGLRAAGRPRARTPRPHHLGMGVTAAGLLHHRRSVQRADRGGEPADQADQASRLRVPQLRQLRSSCCTAASPGTLTKRHGSEAGHHVPWRRATKPIHRHTWGAAVADVHRGARPHPAAGRDIPGRLPAPGGRRTCASARGDVRHWLDPLYRPDPDASASLSRPVRRSCDSHVRRSRR